MKGRAKHNLVKGREKISSYQDFLAEKRSDLWAVLSRRRKKRRAKTRKSYLATKAEIIVTKGFVYQKKNLSVIKLLERRTGFKLHTKISDNTFILTKPLLYMYKIIKKYINKNRVF